MDGRIAKIFSECDLAGKYCRVFILSDSINDRRHPKLKKAIVEAAEKEKAIEHLRNFEDGWDFLKLVHLVVQLEKDPFPNLKEVKQELIKCRDLRNKKGAHPSYSGRGERGLDDQELCLFIEFAKTYLPRINSLEKESADALKIKRKLRELRSCLYYNEEGEVQTICRTGLTGRLR